ncbi:MAG: sirohydrochlorin chelatase [Planctomycetales bacterium]
MKDEARVGVLLIAHGSRRAEANADLVQLADILRSRGEYPIVETSYLEIAQPDISTGGARCVARGATRVKMFPYFLSAGAHVVEDLEASRQELAARFPGVDFQLCPHLGLHPLMVDIVLERLET